MSNTNPINIIETKTYAKWIGVTVALWLSSVLLDGTVHHIDNLPVLRWIFGKLSILFRDGAIALTIAIALAFTTEKFASQRIEALIADIIQRLKINVWKGIYGRRIPDKIVDEVESVLESDFVLFEYKVTVYLEKLNDLVLRQNHVSYQVQNISSGEREYALRGFITLPLIPNHQVDCKIKEVSARINGQSLFHYPDGSEELKVGNQNSCVKIEKDTMLVFEKVFPLAKDAKASVSVRYQTIHDPIDTEVASCILPADGLDFQVICRDKTFSVKAKALHPNAELIEGDSHNPTNHHYHWCIKQALLPFQGVVYLWRLVEGEKEIGIEVEEDQ